MCYSARTGYCDLYIRQPKSEIGMNQFTKTSLFVYTVNLIQTSSFSISHHTVVCSHNPCKKSEAKYPLPIFMFKTFVIDQSDALVNDCAEKRTVVSLLFLSMRKKQILL